MGTAVGQTAKSKYDDEDGNGIPDEGEVVTGTYKSVYAYDANGDWYWDLGDGRVQGTVGGVDELDQETLTVCDYKVQYRGSFENDPFLDSGWVRNNINCKGYDDNGNYNYLIIHKTDPRYTGNRPPAFGGDWEYFVDVESKLGNKLVRPQNPPGQN
ncbi:hypothetical protein GJR96_09045 [Haloferax sp. MBLA0076]|uniref:Uncharacterized protein n=1 Tax=Haloferax litoreum TaxID=2666140 RepID=A0A6A8GH10_9EURY|nr:hypothetical protein Hfx1148_09030 [Haloferax sp. CBA1148]MRX22101.1 hypothetical protein [Haloferax litoreum]